VNTLLRHHHSLYEAELWVIEAESDLNTLRERNSDIHRLLDERKAEIDRLKSDMDAQKALSNNILKEVIRLKQDMSEQDEAVLKEWSQREASLDDLNAEIEATNGRIELLHAGNPQLLQNYERRQRDIDKLETALNNFDTDLANVTNNISQLRERWEPELDRLVCEINDAFAHNFEQIGCAGQVGIEKCDDDFAKWAIRIEVKFRYVGWRFSTCHDPHRILGRTNNFHYWTLIGSLVESVQSPQFSTLWHFSHLLAHHFALSMR